MDSHPTKRFLFNHTAPFSTKGLKKSLCDFAGTTFVQCENPVRAPQSFFAMKHCCDAADFTHFVENENFSALDCRNGKVVKNQISMVEKAVFWVLVQFTLTSFEQRGDILFAPEEPSLVIKYTKQMRMLCPLDRTISFLLMMTKEENLRALRSPQRAMAASPKKQFTREHLQSPQTPTLSD